MLDRADFDMIEYSRPAPPAPGPHINVPSDILHIFNTINKVRASNGCPAFIYDVRLAAAAQEAVMNGWAYHENFAQRLSRQGFSPDYSDRSKAEGSFPAVGPDQTIEGLMNSMQTYRRNGPHARDFFDARFTRIGLAYGGRGDLGLPFFVFVYSQ